MKKTLLITTGIIVLLVTFASSAYLVGRSLRKSSSKELAISGQPQLLEAGDQSGRQMFTINLEESEELPDKEPDVIGFFSHWEDNSLYVNESDGGAFIVAAEDGEISTNAGSKETEVVLTKETIVYRDATFDNLDASSSGGEFKQILKPGSVDEIGEMSPVLAWGEKRGDRLVAKVLVYNRPPVISR
ncbi:MAG: hypothetical protein JXA42_04170 [Anaerolineales bacterium]|nr:hypothetical protein [Anaerolineales bacterium]